MARRLGAIRRTLALCLLAASQADAGELDIRQLNPTSMEVRSAADPDAWHIRYGTTRNAFQYVHAAAGPGDAAFFSHQNWLRRIDVRRGVVTGRWLFPGDAIIRLAWEDGRLQVDVLFDSFDRRDVRLTRTFAFDPEAPALPSASAYNSGVASAEAATLRTIQAAAAEKLLPEFENAVQRDPFSPWLRVALGRLYALLDRPGAAPMFEEAVNIDAAHFSELFRISTYLDELRQHGPARTAFERGYAEFWKQGHDPRLMGNLLLRGSRSLAALPEDARHELVNRAWLLTPWAGGAEGAWRLFGTYLESRGDTEESAKWRARSEEARARGLTNPSDTLAYAFETARTVARGALAALVFFVAVLYFRYRPQRQARLAAARAAGVSCPGFLNVEYWRRSERAAFLVLAAAAWLAGGLRTELQSRMILGLTASYQLDPSNILSPKDIRPLQSALPPGPERDLLLAFAYQRDGQVEPAETLYRQLPDFPESWNNLGVILSSTGRSAEAQRAFERALELSPELAEAELNLGRAPRDEWTELHAKYRPGQPMIAPPARERLLGAVGIRMDFQAFTGVLKGPLGAGPEMQRRPYRDQFPLLRTGLLVAALFGAAVVVFLRPREVIAAPPRFLIVPEILLPGAARAWGVFGGLILGIFFSLASLPFAETETSFLLRNAAPLVLMFNGPDDLEGLGASDRAPVLAGLGILLAVNAGLVLRGRSEKRRMTTANDEQAMVSGEPGFH